MTPLRTNVAVAMLAVAATLFYLLIAAEVSFDVLAIVAVVGIFMASFFDVRMLFAGWFLVAPYFEPTAAEGSVNIASNIGHMVLVPFIAFVSIALMIIRGRRLSLGREDFILVVFVLYAFLSSFLATNGRYEDLRQIYLVYTIPFFLYTIIKNVDIDTSFIRMLAFAAIFQLVTQTLLGVHEFRTGEIFYPPRVNTWFDVGGHKRIADPFGSPIIVGLFVVNCFAYIYLAYKWGVIPRLVLWISGALSSLLVLLTFTRSVWLGAFAALAYMTYRTGLVARRQILRLAIATIMIVALIGAIIMAFPEIQQRLTGEENANFRIVMAKVGWSMFLANPIVGWGQGTFDDVSERYLFDDMGVYIKKDTSHVTLLTIMAELGLLGASLLIAFIYFNLSSGGIHIADLHFDDRLLVAVNTGGIIMIMINAFLIDIRFYSLAYSWLFIHLGFINNVYRTNRLTMVEEETIWSADPGRGLR